MRSSSLFARLLALVLLALLAPPLMPPSARSAPLPIPPPNVEYATHNVLLTAASAASPEVRRWLSHAAADPAHDLWITLRARTVMMPEVRIASPQGATVRISGSSAQIATLLKQLEPYPVLAAVNWLSPGESPIVAQETTSASASSNFVYLRMPWAANVIWGSTTPNTSVSATIRRHRRTLYQVQQQSDELGRYELILPDALRKGDRVTVSDGTQEVNTRVQAQQNAARRQSTTSGTTMHTAPDGAILLQNDMPLSIEVRRDTRYGVGIVEGDAQNNSINSQVGGYASAETQVQVRLVRAGATHVQRITNSDPDGRFDVALDTPIESDDTIIVAAGSTEHTIDVPELHTQVDVVTQRVKGQGPANSGARTGTQLKLSFHWNELDLHTDPTGAFDQAWSLERLLPGRIGTMVFTNVDGHRIYASVFIGEPLARGIIGDSWADVVLGQPDFGTITPNTVSANRLFRPAGVHIDRSSTPNRAYVFDGGNNRILGMQTMGTTEDGRPCTSDSDYNTPCFIDPDREADIVLGQPDMRSSTCNGDSNYQSYPEVPPAAATTLCGMRAQQMSILEGGAGAGMATDTAGNLYTPDYFNNRILRYNDPFANDTRADGVWGQADFAGHTCNRGRGQSRPDAHSLCLAPPPGVGYLVAGVAIDSAGNLWVTDNQNHRVLRFPYNEAHGMPSETADLVLGQADFFGALPGTRPTQMDTPNAVRVDQRGNVFVADTLNHRILRFSPPLQSGMRATAVITVGVHTPAGLEFAPDGSLWVNNTGYNQLLRIVDGTPQDPVTYYSVGGGIGIDKDSNLQVASANFELHQGVRFVAPDYQRFDLFFDAPTNSENWPNRTTLNELNRAYGIEVTNEQLIASDGGRMLFWNQPWSAVNGQPADGAVGVPDGASLPNSNANFGRMRMDKQGRLWVIFLEGIDSRLRVYQLPLTSAAEPLFEVRSPLSTLEGEPFFWSEFISISGIAMQPDCDCVWISDRGLHRVFRIRNASSAPVVDVVLGQQNAAGIACNQGRDERDDEPQFPDAHSLCAPGGLSFDNEGNLYVADHNLEFHGNKRLLVFEKATLPLAPETTLYNVAASRFLGHLTNATTSGCRLIEQDVLCMPFEAAFFADGRVLVGMNGYSQQRFPIVFDRPVDGQQALSILGDYGSMPTSIRSDRFGNIYVVDHNRTRVLIYLSRPTVEPSNTALPSPTNTGEASPTPSYTASPTEATQPTQTSTGFPLPDNTPQGPTMTPSPPKATTPTQTSSSGPPEPSDTPHPSASAPTQSTPQPNATTTPTDRAEPSENETIYLPLLP
ncbi:hypothetical protein HC891_05750 [Candidatus Gracilibacteria bacterium]|nr:hypothetical protein [Candidatus Gracilibacteria bacterium]